MIKYTTGFVDKLEDILQESKYTVRYERGNFQSGWCLLDHKRVVVLNKFLNTEGRVNTLVDLIPQLKIDYDKLTLSSQKLYEFLTENRLEQSGGESQINDEPAVVEGSENENPEIVTDAPDDAQKQLDDQVQEQDIDHEADEQSNNEPTEN
ncbi:hypothetical protein [Arachidicoccus terrestris]|uniref:hypothetical protein n=1 Tax=Arachidicoccus terrestris TaxID=2875539 RepID=UPI001CC3A2A4|nr:hypothetical protein [Arachidicoccus terrestris]UAY54305.1 hypothetical protein K9M52_12670 [Arachidicoccus terrestris]